MSSYKHPTCNICMEKYDKLKHLPKALPCLHTFCLECLESMTEKSKDTIKCPLCCDIVDLQENSAKNLPNNRAIIDIIDDVDDDSVLACEIHKNQTVILVCVTCYEGLCILCVKSLSKGAHAKHDLEEIDASVTAIKSQIVEEGRRTKDEWEKYQKKNFQQISNDVWQVRKRIDQICDDLVRNVLDWKEEKIREIEDVKEKELEKIRCKTKQALIKQKIIDIEVEKFESKISSIGDLFKLRKMHVERPVEDMKSCKDSDFDVSYGSLVENICQSDFFRDESSDILNRNFTTSTPINSPSKPPLRNFKSKRSPNNSGYRKGRRLQTQRMKGLLGNFEKETNSASASASGYYSDTESVKSGPQNKNRNRSRKNLPPRFKTGESNQWRFPNSQTKYYYNRQKSNKQQVKVPEHADMKKSSKEHALENVMPVAKEECKSDVAKAKEIEDDDEDGWYSLPSGFFS